MNEIIKNENIESLIYEVRGKQVMLSSDVAKLYNVETKVLNQTIKRNIKRLPYEFCFQLTNEEIDILSSRSQIVTLNKSNNLRGYNIKYLPYVLTEQGISILSGLLKSKNLMSVNNQISNAFSEINQNENIQLSQEVRQIRDIIYEINGVQVMLDSDLATLYQVDTKRINEAVKNNIEKFPERFSWKLNDLDSKLFLVENFDQKNKIELRGGKYKNPRVFTEQGVAMLATILKSKVATEVSIRIMDAFVLMKRFISNNLIEQKYYNDMILRHDTEIKELQTAFKKFDEKKVINQIYFNGQIYDAYSKILDIFKLTKNELIIIDSYADKTILDMISKLNVKVTLITKNTPKLSKLDIE